MTKTDLKLIIEQVMIEQLQQVYQALKIQMRKIVKEEIQKGTLISQGSRSNVKSMLNMPSHQKIATPSYATVQQQEVPYIPNIGSQRVINTGNSGKFSVNDILNQTRTQLMQSGGNLSQLGVGSE